MNSLTWYGKYKLSYDQEMAFLKNRMKKGFDPYDYTNNVADFLETEGIEFEHDNELEDYEIGELWIPKATPEQIKKFEIYIESRDPKSIEETLEPATRHMEFKEIQKPGWLIHFTYRALDIAKEGFKFGHPEFEGLGLTTWKMDRKKYAGFNFAFEIGREAEIAAREKKYGSHAVVFWASGVKTYHYGDQENQVIFWGPSVNTNMIFPITSDRNDWTVEAANGRVMIANKPFDEAVNWVVNNWRMLQNIKTQKIK